MRRKSWMTVPAVLLVCALAVTGCGKQADEKGKAKEADAQAGEDGKVSGEISIWHYHKGLEYDQLTKAIEEYEEMNPGLTITETFVSRDELMNQYNIGAVSGELPDIGMVDSPDMSSYISLGVFDDIDAELQAWGEIDNFYEGPLNSCRDSEGHLHGLPISSNCLGLACNMDMLRAAGYEEPPATWDELYEIAKACTKDGVYGFTMSGIATEEGTFQFMPWLYSTGETISSLDSEGGIKAMEFLARLTKEGIMSKEVTNWTQSEAFRTFAAGKAAMSMAGTWHIAQVDSGDIAADFDLQYALLPKDKEYSTCIGGENYGVCSNSENKEAAIGFLKYAVSKEKNAEWCDAVSSQPIRKDSTELDGIWKADDRFQVFTQAMDYSVARGPHPEWPTISEAVYRNEQAALLGEKDPKEAIKAAAEVIDPILEKEPINVE